MLQCIILYNVHLSYKWEKHKDIYFKPYSCFPISYKIITCDSSVFTNKIGYESQQLLGFSSQMKRLTLLTFVTELCPILYAPYTWRASWCQRKYWLGATHCLTGEQTMFLSLPHYITVKISTEKWKFPIENNVIVINLCFDCLFKFSV